MRALGRAGGENANLRGEAYERAAADRETFWADQAERLTWDTRWSRVLDWSTPPSAKWFVDGGHLVLTQPWPSMLRTIWGDDERFKETYWSQYEEHGWYFAGDRAKRDTDGDLWMLGRVDDVVNVSGHRLSTTEVESALASHPTVSEAAVVGVEDEDTGQALCAFVVLRESALDAQTHDGGAHERADINAQLRRHVRRTIGPIATPRRITIVDELPKTRSGKIMRRLLRDVTEHRAVGDVTTLADSSVMDSLTRRIDAPED